MSLKGNIHKCDASSLVPTYSAETVAGLGLWPLALSRKPYNPIMCQCSHDASEVD